MVTVLQLSGAAVATKDSANESPRSELFSRIKAELQTAQEQLKQTTNCLTDLLEFVEVEQKREQEVAGELHKAKVELQQARSENQRLQQQLAQVQPSADSAV